jgi:hypothetical protein
VVEDADPCHQLVLLAKGRPFGKARITLRLFDIHDGCRIELAEIPVGAPMGWVPKRAALPLPSPATGSARRDSPPLPSGDAPMSSGSGPTKSPRPAVNRAR